MFQGDTTIISRLMKASLFVRLPKPSDSEVAQVMERVAQRIVRLLERRGLGPQADPEEADPLLRSQPLPAELYSATVQGRIATGPRAGNRVTNIGFQIEPENNGSKKNSGCANVSGFSLHATVCIPAKARRQLENLCRYAARPAIAHTVIPKSFDRRNYLALKGRNNTARGFRRTLRVLLHPGLGIRFP
jgi:hypothetical protein